MPHPAPPPWLLPGRLITLCAALLAPALLLAAEPAGAANPATDPLDPQAPVPALVHRPVFGAYRPLGDAPLRDWKEVNQEVNRIGGWRAYTREAQQALRPPPAPPATLPEAAASRPAQGPTPQAPHPGHQGHPR